MRCAYGATPRCKVHEWRPVLEALRGLVLSCGLTEELKWGVPCYTYQGKNILIIAAFKSYASLSFFKGALLRDDNIVLVSPGSNSRSTKALRIIQPDEVVQYEADIKRFIAEAISLEERGVKVPVSSDPDPIPDELSKVFLENPALKRAFFALTPGRRRGYILHFSQPKQAETRASRIQKCIDMILRGEGLHDAYQRRSN